MSARRRSVFDWESASLDVDRVLHRAELLRRERVEEAHALGVGGVDDGDGVGGVGHRRRRQQLRLHALEARLRDEPAVKVEHLQPVGRVDHCEVRRRLQDEGDGAA